MPPSTSDDELRELLLAERRDAGWRADLPIDALIAVVVFVTVLVGAAFATMML